MSHQHAIAALLIFTSLSYHAYADLPPAPKAVNTALFDSIWVNARGGMGSGYAHSVTLQRGSWGVEHAYLLFDKTGWITSDQFFDEDTEESFEPEVHGSALSASYRYVGSVGSLKASVGIGYFNGTWGFDCKQSKQPFVTNQYCDHRDVNDVAFVYGVEIVLGRYWGLGFSADYAIVQSETLVMGGVTLPIRVLSN